MFSIQSFCLLGESLWLGLSRFFLGVPRPTQNSEASLRLRKPGRMISFTLVLLFLAAPAVNAQSEPTKDVVPVEKGERVPGDGFWVPDEYFDECEALTVAYPACVEAKEGLLKSLLKAEATQDSLRRQTRTWRTVGLVAVALSGGLIIGLTVRRVLK